MAGLNFYLLPETTDDKLPAISGVAATIHGKTGSPYVAGLWKDNLLCDLWWETDPYLVPGTKLHTTECLGDPNTFEFLKLRTPSHYRAPSFSWASIDFVPVQYSRIGSSGSDFEPHALVLQAECTVKGANEYGEVTDGFILLEALLVEADLRVTSDRYGWIGYYTVDRNGIKARMQADLPLVVGLSFTESGEEKPTVKRARTGDAIVEFTAKVYTLALGRDRQTYAMLVLGGSESTCGAYKRLGIINLHIYEDQPYAFQEWFEDAKQSIVKIV